MSMADLGEGMTWSAGTPHFSVVIGAGAHVLKPQGRSSTQSEQQIVGNLTPRICIMLADVHVRTSVPNVCCSCCHVRLQ